MRNLIILALVLACPLLAKAQLWSGIIPSAQGYDWQNSTGLVPVGGIPARTTLCSTLTSTATSATIQSALNSCTTGQAVFLSAGTYTIGSTITIPSNVTLRGAGANQTILHSTVAGGPIIKLGSSGPPYGGQPGSIPGSVPVLSGATQGATTLTVSTGNSVNFHVNQIMNIDEVQAAPANGSSNTTGVPSGNGSEGSCTTAGNDFCDMGQRQGRVHAQVVFIIAVNTGTGVITFTPALTSAYTNSAQVVSFNSTQKAGVENLQLYATNTGSTANVQFVACAYCWLTGIEDNYTDGAHVYVDWSINGEINWSYFSDAYVHQSGTDCVVELRARSSFFRLQANILERLHTGIIIEQGASGNVIAYNYANLGDFEASGCPGSSCAPFANFSGIDFHGAHPEYNLFEGNVVTSMGGDSVWGTEGPNVAFRNWIVGTSKVCSPFLNGRQSITCTPIMSYPQTTVTGGAWQFQASRALNVSAFSIKDSYVYDVIGSPQQNALVSYSPTSFLTPVQQSWSICGGTSGTPCGSSPGRSYDAVSYEINWGFGETFDGGGTGANGQGCNPTSLPYPCHSQYPQNNNTVYKEYLYGASGTICNVTCTTAAPASFYLAAKPAWFPSSVKFPPIGPDVTGGAFAGGVVGYTPSTQCYTNVMLGDGGTGSPYSYNANSCYTSGPTSNYAWTPASYSFGNVNVGALATQTFQLQNTGSATGNVALSIQTPGGIFSLQPGGTCGATLTVGSSCNAVVGFQPTSTSAYGNNLVETDTPFGVIVNAALSGTGIIGGFGFSPTSVNFGNVIVGNPASPQTVTLTNNTGSTVTISSMSIIGVADFGFSTSPASNCGGSLTNATSCTVTFTFTPTTTGSRTATFSTSDSATGSPHTVALSGNGTSIGAPSGLTISIGVSIGKGIIIQ